jgi:BolA protein
MGAGEYADKELTDVKQALSRAERMENALRASFAPVEFNLVDESSRHAGHAGARPEGETHFRLRLRAAAFIGLSRLARQRLVNEALSEEFANGLHALSLELKAPGEA